MSRRIRETWGTQILLVSAKAAGRACREPVEGSARSTRALRAIIAHGELAPTDRYHCPHADQVPRLDEADAGEPSAGRSHNRQEGLRLLPETSRGPESRFRRALPGPSARSRARAGRNEDGSG